MNRELWVRRVGDNGPWIAVAAVGTWAAWPGATTLVLTAAITVLALLLDGRRGTLRSLGLMVILATVVVGFFHLDARRNVRGDWPSVWAEEESRIVEELQEALRPILE